MSILKVLLPGRVFSKFEFKFGHINLITTLDIGKKWTLTYHYQGSQQKLGTIYQKNVLQKCQY